MLKKTAMSMYKIVIVCNYFLFVKDRKNYLKKGNLQH
jgi:hypothetical protein